MRRLLTFAIVGLIAQLVDGTLGMAFGVTSSTLLLATGSSVAATSAGVHLAEIATSFASGASHWRVGNVNWVVFRRLALPGGIGAFIGATLLSNIDAAAAAPWISLVLLLLGLHLFLRFAFFGLPAGTDTKVVPRTGRGLLTPLGVFGGFVDAVGGGGWGPVTTPTLLTAGRMEPRQALGTTAATEFVVAVSASAAFLTNLGTNVVDLRLVAALAGGGVVVAPLAATLSRRLPPAVLGILVGGLILLTNSRTIMRSLEVDSPERYTVYGALVVATGVAAVAASRRMRALEPSPRELIPAAAQLV